MERRTSMDFSNIDAELFNFFWSQTCQDTAVLIMEQVQVARAQYNKEVLNKVHKELKKLLVSQAELERELIYRGGTYFRRTGDFPDYATTHQFSRRVYMEFKLEELDNRVNSKWLTSIDLLYIDGYETVHGEDDVERGYDTDYEDNIPTGSGYEEGSGCEGSE